MKKIVISLLVVGVIAAAFVLSRSGGSATTNANSMNNGADTEGSAESDRLSVNRNAFLGKGDKGPNSDLTDEGIEESQARPAYEIYKSSDEALEALQKGAKDYDDLVLEQFTNLGSDCQWCDPLYASVREKMISKDTPAEQRSYYAEVLAISGRLENVEALVEEIKNTKGDNAEIFAEALELTVADDKTVQYLSEQLSTDNATLKEASVAALTNQGSRVAIENLFKHVRERGDPDGYYAQGIGPGEQIPDEDALPISQEYVQKRDAYSHLAAKQLLNGGVDGLRRFLDVLENSSDPAFDQRLINGLEVHVPYEEAAEGLLKEAISNSKSEAARKFAEKALADFNMEGSGDEGGAGEEE
jgi:hypothetical protein